MPIVVAHRSTKAKTLQAKYEDPIILDVTSKGPEPWVRFSPFYPHGSIPVPFSAGRTGASVEGIWQALKVFESEDVDESKLLVENMKGLKRTVRRLGQVLGHRRGIGGELAVSNCFLIWMRGSRFTYRATPGSWRTAWQKRLARCVAALQEQSSCCWTTTRIAMCMI